MSTLNLQTHFIHLFVVRSACFAFDPLSSAQSPASRIHYNSLSMQATSCMFLFFKLCLIFFSHSVCQATTRHYSKFVFVLNFFNTSLSHIKLVLFGHHLFNEKKSPTQFCFDFHPIRLFLSQCEGKDSVIGTIFEFIFNLI